jgi:hypothetical protein
LYKDKKLSISNRQSKRETDAISYIMMAMKGHQPQIFECTHTDKWYILLPENMLKKAKVAARSFGNKGVGVKLVVKNNKRYTKICCGDLLQLEGVVKEIRDKK